MTVEVNLWLVAELTLIASGVLNAVLGFAQFRRSGRADRSYRAATARINRVLDERWPGGEGP